MKNEAVYLILGTLLVASGTGCSRSRSRADREKQRLQVEQQDERAIQRSNEAVNEVSRKLGRKVPLMDLGLPDQKKVSPTAPPTSSSASSQPKS